MGKTTHGLTKTPEYKTWHGMHIRCSYPSTNGFSRYGGRGIRVCKRWLLFPNFLSDMGSKPSTAHSLDRINPNGHYEPSNCRWATIEEQVSNRRDSRNLTFQGKTQHMSKWSRELGIKITTIHMRLKRGWSDHDTLSTKT